MRLRLGLVPTAIAAVIAGTPIAAHADTNSHRDARRDVTHSVSDGSEPVPRNKTADITRVSVNYTRTTLTMRMRLRDLRSGNDYVVIDAIHVPAGRTYYASLDGDRPDRVGQRILLNSRRVRCPGKSLAFRPARDLFVQRIPARCLGNPDWVRIQETVITLGGTTFIDEGRARGNRTPRFSPRIHRG